MKLFTERYIDNIDNGVLNLSGFNHLPGGFPGQFKYYSNVNDLLKSEIKDYSQGCYDEGPS